MNIVFDCEHAQNSSGKIFSIEETGTPRVNGLSVARGLDEEAALPLTGKRRATMPGGAHGFEPRAHFDEETRAMMSNEAIKEEGRTTSHTYLAMSRGTRSGIRQLFAIRGSPKHTHKVCPRNFHSHQSGSAGINSPVLFGPTVMSPQNQHDQLGTYHGRRNDVARFNSEGD